jgi:hypothetical protein
MQRGTSHVLTALTKSITWICLLSKIFHYKLKYLWGCISLDNDTDHYIIIKILQHFQHTIGTITAILNILNEQEFSSVGLQTQGMT